MNAEEFMYKLFALHACQEAVDFCKGKSLQEAWEQCETGEWMCWLASKAPNYDFRAMKLCNGHQANTVRELMEAKVSIAAVDAAIAYGNGKITKDALSRAYLVANTAFYKYDIYSSAAYSAQSAYFSASEHTSYSAANTSAKAASAAYYPSSESAKKANQLLTAEIARKYLPIPIF